MSRSSIRYIVIFIGYILMLNLALDSSTAQAGSWIKIGPDGGSIKVIAVDPTDANTVYVGTALSGIYKSTDGGANWQAANSGIQDVGNVSALAIDPDNPSTIYAGGVYKSTDGAGSWTAMNLEANAGAFAIDPSNTSTVYAATSNGVYRSTNGGGTWTLVLSKIGQEEFQAMAIDPNTNPSTVYAGAIDYGGSNGGVHKSTDGGQNWISVNNNLGNTDINVLIAHPMNSGTVYVATEEGLYTSTNYGVAWALEPLSSGRRMITLSIDPGAPSTIYTNEWCGTVVKTTDGGANWAPTGLAYEKVCTQFIAVAPSNSSVVYAATDFGVFKSTDSGDAWSSANKGINARLIYSLAVHPSSPQTVYVGTWSGDVFKSSDGGATWIYRHLENLNAITAMAIDPSDPDMVYAGEYRDIYKSSDGGINWSVEMRIDPNAGTILSIAVNPEFSDVLYAGTESGVWKSINGGGSWSQNGLPSAYVTSVVINPRAPDTVYAGVAFEGADSGVYKTTDGETWVPTTLTDKYILSLAIDPTAPNIVYAGSRYFPNLSSEGVYKTTDGGSIWSSVNEGLFTYTYYNALVIDQLKPSHIYAGGSEGGICIGVYRSRKGGSSWSAMNNGLGNNCIRDLAIGPGNRTIIYAGTEAGVYKISDTASIAPLELILLGE